MEVYTETKRMMGKSNDARYSVIPCLTFCVTVHYLCPLVGCHGDGVPGYGAFAGPECETCLEEGFQDFK